MKRAPRYWHIGLLVVTVSVLVLVLMPITSVTPIPADTQCLSNLKQLALATSMYSTDHDGYHPPFITHSGTDRSNGGRAIQWMLCLLPYVKNSAVFICPNDQLGRKHLIPSYHHPAGFPGEFVEGFWIVREDDFQGRDSILLEERSWMSEGDGQEALRVSFHGNRRRAVRLSGAVVWLTPSSTDERVNRVPN